MEDTLSFGGAYLVDPALESALEARDEGRWNAAWAERYGKRDGQRPAYSDVIRFLEESRKRRRDEFTRLRRTRAIVVAAAFLFAALAIAASWFWWSARRSGQQALARQLAADSGLRRNSDLDWTTAALLGIESLRRAEIAQGYDALSGASGGMRRRAQLAHQGPSIGGGLQPRTAHSWRPQQTGPRACSRGAGGAVSVWCMGGSVVNVAFSRMVPWWRPAQWTRPRASLGRAPGAGGPCGA